MADMRNFRIPTIVVAICSALVGAVAVLWWQLPRVAESRHVRDEFVPTQDLSLTDATGFPLGALSVESGLVTLHLYTGGTSGVYSQVFANIYSGGRVYVDIEGRGEMTGITVGLNHTDVWDFKRGSIYGAWTDLSEWDRTRNQFLPSRGIHFYDDAALPSEDIHLRNRDGWVFASLGTTATGDPALALADAQGSVRLMWALRRGVQEADWWWDVAVWDKAGIMRMNLELRRGQKPDLVLFADRLGTQYAVDFVGHKLVTCDNAHSSALAWMPSVEFGERRMPIRVSDNRGRKLWGAR
jgi:hypothetical protein